MSEQQTIPNIAAEYRAQTAIILGHLEMRLLHIEEEIDKLRTRMKALEEGLEGV